MIEQSVAVVIDALSMLGILQKAMRNCQLCILDDYRIIARADARTAELAHIRITEVPVIETSLALRRALAAAKEYMEGTGFEEAIAELDEIHERTLQLRLLEIALRGVGLRSSELVDYAFACENKHSGIQWALMTFTADEIESEVSAIRQDRRYQYSLELVRLEHLLRQMLAEYKAHIRRQPVQKFLCTVEAGNPDWQPLVVEARDEYRARQLAIGIWRGIAPDEVGVEDEIEVRFTCLSKLREADSTETV